VARGIVDVEPTVGAPSAMPGSLMVMSNPSTELLLLRVQRVTVSGVARRHDHEDPAAHQSVHLAAHRRQAGGEPGRVERIANREIHPWISNSQPPWLRSWIYSNASSRAAR
jgi:hypothetical protein